MCYNVKKCQIGENCMEKKDVKKVSVANFNVVFMTDTEEKPLLAYFDSIVMPAFNSGITKTTGDSQYLFMDVKIEQDSSMEYVLTGLIVKSTVLEIKSMFDEGGNLISRDDTYPTAPFSTFVIYLKNHRMLLIENQKGSPRLDSFRSTAKHVLDIYVRMRNSELEKNNQSMLPIPIVSIVGIPPRGGIAAQLKKAEKITKLTLKFYPLNGDGDIDFSAVMGGISNKLRRMVGSNRGEVMFLSPQNVDGVVEVVEQSEGTVEPVIRVRYPGNSGDSTIRIDQVSERRRMVVAGNNRNEEMQNMIEQGREIESINYVSGENSNIYLTYQDNIIPFVEQDD